MDHPPHPPTPTYKSPRSAQVWFLARSRGLWKAKYRDLKVEHKRLQNRLRDVAKGRDAWRAQAEQLRHRVRELEAAAAAAGEKKTARGGRG